MNFNSIGKVFVLLYVVTAILALSWTAAVYLQWIDWGWKEPRIELDRRVASEYDTRAARLAQAQRARDLAYVHVKPSKADVATAEEFLVQNHLWYGQELNRLMSDPDPIEVKNIKNSDGGPELEPAPKSLGKPVLEPHDPKGPLPELKKSYAAYRADMKKLEFFADVVTMETRSWVEAQKDITEALIGASDDKGKRIKAGLYQLIEDEGDIQDRVKFEKENYLRPIWANNREQAKIYGERFILLNQRLEQVKKARPK